MNSIVLIEKIYSLKYPILSVPNLPVTHIYNSMSKNEILSGKLSANRTVSVESPIVVDEKKKERGGRRRGRLLLFLMAVGLGAVALTSITLLAPVTFYDHVASPGSISDGSNSGGSGGSGAIPTALAASSSSSSSSATAMDGKGTIIEDNGVTKSAEMTITGYYSDSSFSTQLRCSIDSLPAYCSGSPVTLSGLPTGEHTFTVVEPISDKITVQSFSWDILE